MLSQQTRGKRSLGSKEELLKNTRGVVDGRKEKGRGKDGRGLAPPLSSHYGMGGGSREASGRPCVGGDGPHITTQSNSSLPHPKFYFPLIKICKYFHLFNGIHDSMNPLQINPKIQIWVTWFSYEILLRMLIVPGIHQSMFISISIWNLNCISFKTCQPLYHRNQWKQLLWKKKKS